MPSGTTCLKSRHFSHVLRNQHLSHLNRAGGGRVDLCTRQEIEVSVGARKIDLSKQENVRSIMEKGKEFAFIQCDTISKEGKGIIVRVFQDPYSKQKDSEGNKFWAAYFKYVNQDAYAYHADQVSYHNVMNKPKEASQVVAQATQPVAQNVKGEKKLTRTIEGFTLGMSLSEAKAFLERGFKEKRFEPLGLPFRWADFVGQAMVVPKERKRMQDELEKNMVTEATLENVPISTLRSFRSSDWEEVTLQFYGGKLFQITAQLPSSKDEWDLKAAFESKYGRPNQVEGRMGTPPSAPAGVVSEPTNARLTWRDSMTTITLRLSWQGHRAVYADPMIFQVGVEKVKQEDRTRKQEYERQQKVLPKNF